MELWSGNWQRRLEPDMKLAIERWVERFAKRYKKYKWFRYYFDIGPSLSCLHDELTVKIRVEATTRYRFGKAVGSDSERIRLTIRDNGLRGGRRILCDVSFLKKDDALFPVVQKLFRNINSIAKNLPPTAPQVLTQAEALLLSIQRL